MNETTTIHLPELTVGKVSHNHAAHLAARFWVKGCAQCDARYDPIYGSREQFEREHPERKTHRKANCAACLGENKA